MCGSDNNEMQCDREEAYIQKNIGTRIECWDSTWSYRHLTNMMKTNAKLFQMARKLEFVY